MNCNFVKNRMSCYVDGELPGAEMLAMRRHLETCESCRKMHESEKAAKKLLAALPEREASPEFEGRLLAAVRSSATDSKPEAAGYWPTGRTMLAFAAAAVAVFCVFLLRGEGAVEPIGTQGNEIAQDQDWNDARNVFPASNLPAGLQGP